VRSSAHGSREVGILASSSCVKFVAEAGCFGVDDRRLADNVDGLRDAF